MISPHAALMHQQEYRDAILIRGADYPASKPSGVDTAVERGPDCNSVPNECNIVGTNLKAHRSN